MTNFWTLSPPERTNLLVEWAEDSATFETVYCPLKPGHQRAGKRIGQLRILIKHVEPPDIMWTWMSECLIQDHVLAAFQSARLSGYSAKPVEVTFAHRTARRIKLFELIVTGWGGMAAPASGVSLNAEKSCSVCGHQVYTAPADPNKLVDANQWDGSDFFIIWPMPKYIVVAQRTVDVIRDSGFKGASIVPLNQLQIAGDTLVPGRLSYYFDDPRARELGEPLGIF